ISAISKENPEQTATAVVTLVGADAEDHVIVQVGSWSHTYYIPDFDRDMCKIWPENGIITVRDETDVSEYFELKLDEPGWNGVSFGLGSDMKFFVAGEEAARLMAEGFGTTTPIPAIDPSMFAIERGFASGTVAMLDLINDRIEMVTIKANCDPDKETPW
ncbi:MAG TPA: hypothetical protein PK890_04720, partial [Terrimesophilobacter sp.]|nr:hypothetical protein [Terrimesophilobacter sp.]